MTGPIGTLERGPTTFFSHEPTYLFKYFTISKAVRKKKQYYGSSSKSEHDQ